MSLFVRILVALSPLAVGAVSGIATTSNINTWYQFLNKPSFNPPNWLFGPVWTTLYILMGITVFILYGQSKSSTRKQALTSFWIQLLLNGLWSFLFFYWHLIGFALLEIAILWICILWMIVLTYRANRTAGLLQIPYILWVSFASILNFAIWQLND